MNNRTLEVAALVLIAWALLQSDRDEVRRRVVVSGPEFSHLDWEEAHSDAVIGDEEFDRDDVDIDADLDDPSLRNRVTEASRLGREERSRLRREIREQLDQARQEGRRVRAQWRAEYGDFRDSRNQIREEIKRDIRESLRSGRDEFRELRDQVREIRNQFRNQARALKNEIRQSVRNAVRIRREDKRTIRIDDDVDD